MSRFKLSDWFAPLRHSLFGYSQSTARLILLGLDAAGKTTFLYKIKRKSYEDVVTTIPTIGFNVETLELQNFNLTCWDVGGCDKIRPLWRHFTTGSSILVLMVDSNDRDRVEDGKTEFGWFLEDETLANLPLLILANKQDLPNAMSVDEVLDKFGVSKITDRPWYIMGTVACEGGGIPEALSWIEHTLKPNKKSWAQVAPNSTGISSDWYFEMHPNVSDTGSNSMQFSFTQKNLSSGDIVRGTESTSIVADALSSTVIKSDDVPENHQHITPLNNTSQLNSDSSEQIAVQMAAAKKQQDAITREQTLTAWVERARLELTLTAVDVVSSDVQSAPLPHLSDDVFLSQVADCSLGSWDHYTHIRLGWIVITRHQSAGQSLQSAFESVAESIAHFIAHSERTNGKSFHRTMTHFWCHMIAAQIQLLSSGAVSVEGVADKTDKDVDFVMFLRSVFDPRSVDLWSTSLFKSYFSNGVLFGAEARSSVVVPDLMVLPELK